MYSLNQKNIDEFRRCQKTTNDLSSFCSYFRKSPHLLLVRDIAFSLNLPSPYMLSRISFVNTIIEEVYFICNNVILIDPSPEYVFHEICNNVECAFEKNEFEGVITAIISGWVACVYLGAELDLNRLKKLSINAVCTNKLQKLMATQWQYMEPIMEKQMNNNLEKIIKTIFKKATENATYDNKCLFNIPDLLRKRTEERLNKKMAISSNEKEYLRSLAENYAYYDNQCLLIHDALCDWLENKNHPSPQHCSMQLDLINGTSRDLASLLKITNDDWQSQLDNILMQQSQKQRNILEYGYEIRSLKSDLLIDFVGIFANSEDFVKDLYNYSAEDVALYVVNTANQLARACQQNIT